MLPTRKVGGGAFAGASTLVLTWGLRTLGVDVPPEVASALTVVIMSGVSYMVRD